MKMMPDTAAAAAISTDRDWYKDAIIYQLHVKAFADSNDDGVGDFAGLTDRLDYLQDLGVTALWLLPFYPSPGRDDGYDIADYRRINPDFGTMKDFRRFMAEAKARGLKIVTELVVNHTSDQHPWFKRARRSPPSSSARGWYVWSDTDQRYHGTRIIFTDTEKSNWTWDSVAGAYYWHRFFAHQPDLNYENPQVFGAMVQVMRRWIDVGVDGFRLDAIPYLCEREGTSNENLPETHDVLRRLRAELDAYAPGTPLLAEANQWPEDVAAYFADGEECHMAYHFPLMPRIFMAIGQEDRFPITDIMRQTPDIPANCQWALFLRNHDELTLEMVTDVERDYLWSTYATDMRARINLGIRRRLAPLMDNDRRKIELMNSLLLSFPGTPIVYYGDEIGMGDNIYLGDRNSVRTPMQWTPDRNGGFSRCDPAKLYLPPIMDPVYGYQAVNVEAQSRSLSSLLSWTKRMIAVRKTSKVFGRGSMSFVRSANRSVLSYVREYENEVILCVANLSRSAQLVDLDLRQWKDRVPYEMLGRTRFRRIDDAGFVVTLAPYGFFWLALNPDGDAEVQAVPQVPEWVTLVFSDGWAALRHGRTRRLFEHDVLPAFLAARRWYANKGEAARIQLDAILPWGPANRFALAIIGVATDGLTTNYSLPLSLQWGRLEHGSPRAQWMLAPVRRAQHEGVLMEAIAERDVIAWIVETIHATATLVTEGKTLAFRAGSAFGARPLPPIEQVTPVAVEQSNSTLIVDSAYVLKFYRRLTPGASTEIEIGRFLTEVAGYQHSPALLGTVELVEGDKHTALAVLHEFVRNQGDAWAHTTGYLDRFLEEERLLSVADEGPAAERHAAFLNLIRTIGMRVGELHLALSGAPDVEGFAPEPITPADLAGWTETLIATAGNVFDLLTRRLPSLEPRAQQFAEAFLARREAVFDRIAHLLPQYVEADKIRHHGDLHLGQILLVKDDAYIIDFEGEPQRSETERRRKAPSARDVAGVIRSLDYAAMSSLDRIGRALPEERARSTAALDQWRRESSAALMAGLRQAVGRQRLWPQDEEAADRLLRFFIAEKAFYEIEYELAHRPHWVVVPLAGIERAILGEAMP